VNVKPRTIQKYPNRRMYDTTQHRYVTLEEIRQFVLNREGGPLVACC